DVYIDNTKTINVEIEQREPVVRVIDGEGRNYYLDEAANYMPLSEHHAARVLVLTGFIQPHEPNFMKMPQHRLKDLFELTKRILADDFFRHLIEQVHVSQNGDIIFIPKLGKQQILFGRYLNIDEKLQRLKIFYKEAMPRAGWTKYQMIDIRFKDQVVCKK
ncbi:MAG: cell division protein FtsQ, partial [Bacteroidota bacterium]